MNGKQKEERAIKWLMQVSIDKVLENKPLELEEWKKPWIDALSNAPEEIFSKPDFHEVVELFTWNEIVIKHFGKDEHMAMEYLLNTMEKVRRNLVEKPLLGSQPHYPPAVRELLLKIFLKVEKTFSTM